MQKNSKLWQGVFVTGIIALAAPPFVHGQAAGNSPSGRNSGSPTGVTGTQNLPGPSAPSGMTGSAGTSRNQSGTTDSHMNATPGSMASPSAQPGSPRNPMGATTSEGVRSSQGSISRDVGSSAADQRLNTQIRQALNTDSSLSGIGRNVQLSTANGEVTLRGSVSSEREKLQIEQRVKQLSEVQDVTNELQVVSSGNPSSMGTTR